MKQQTNVHIATPCHEDWNTMTPEKGGKFCASCSKSVVDFTLMSDAQILKFLSAHSNNLCGRFDAVQLQRPLVEPAVSKKKSWYLALVLPFSLLFQKSIGQKGERMMGKPAIKKEQKIQNEDVVITMGMVAPHIISKWVTVHGVLINEAGNPLESATVLVKGTSNVSATDSAGRFSIRLKREEDSVVLVASSVGYQSVEKKVALKDADEEQLLTLTIQESTLGEVVVTSYDYMSCRQVSGGAIFYRTVTHAEKRDSTVRKILRLNPVTIYPNPVRSGGTVHLNIKKAGAYEVQLLNSSSALLKTETLQAGNDGALVSFQLPQVAAGIYYLRLISSDKKTYLEKILVN